MNIIGHEVVPLADGWEAASTEPDAHSSPASIDGLEWLPARVPGTAAAVLADAGRWRLGETRDFDSQDWWFRTQLPAIEPEEGEEAVLCLDGVATVCEVYVDGKRRLESPSMFLRHEIALDGGGELALRCRALKPLLAEQRRPRARWRSRIADNNLRWFRTMILGRAPGLAPGPAAVGPWRPVRIERRRGVAVDELRLRPRASEGDAVLRARVRLRSLGAELPGELELEVGGERKLIQLEGGTAESDLQVPDIERWWPHTHGEPVLHSVRLLGEGLEVDAGRIGFRELRGRPELAGGLIVNGAEVFARGAVWTPADPVSLAPGEGELRQTLERVRAAGMNMVRLAGTGCYESETFHDLCDELGLLVWQDFMFASFDYPTDDPELLRLVEAEARQVLEGLAGRPSLAVLCGNSEVEQQAAMFGLDAAVGRSALFAELLPAWAAEVGADVPYVPSAPSDGELPFRTDRGVASYYGVGGYLRPLADARLAEVRFAAECLAFANVPDDESAGDFVPHDPSDRDFVEVRDHYLAQLFEVDPESLDAEGYSELARATSGEVMAEVFGEWRRPLSPCNGALVLWLRDLEPGSGWGVLDYRGDPKVAYHHLRRSLASVAVWTTDEGLNGIDVHVANDRAEPLAARLRVALYRDFELRMDEVPEELELAPRTSLTRNVEGLLGRFVDVSWAYRFGPPGQDLVVASLESAGDLVAQSFRFPAGRPRVRETAEQLGLEATLVDSALRVRSRRLAYGVRIDGAEPSDNAFSVEPGGERVVELGSHGVVWLSALNLEGRLEVR